ncbi:MAG: hypothetical protein AB3N64_07135 [Puniceicoccaceae bacterium]
MSKTHESQLSTRQGEGLAEGQLRHREVVVGRKPMAKRLLSEWGLVSVFDYLMKLRTASG